MTKAGSPKPPTKLETITLKVQIHCEGCRRKVRRIIRVVDGVEEVTVDSASGKVTITGTADVKTILQRLQKYGKHAEVWPSLNPALPTSVKGNGVNQPKPNNNNGSDSNNIKKNNNGGAEGGGKAAEGAGDHGSRKGDGKEMHTTGRGAVKNELDAAVNESKPEKGKASTEEAIDTKVPTQNGGGGGGGGGGKKGGKKGGNGNNANNNGNSSSISGGGTANVLDVPSLDPPPPPPHDIPITSAPNTSVLVSANKSFAPYDSIQTGYAYHSAEYATHMFSDENANNCSIM